MTGQPDDDLFNRYTANGAEPLLALDLLGTVAIRAFGFRASDHLRRVAGTLVRAPT